MDKEFFEFKGEDRKYKRLPVGKYRTDIEFSDKELDFSTTQSKEKFNETHEGNFTDFGFIDPCIPEDDKYRRRHLKRTLERMLRNIHEAQDNAVKVAIKKVKDEFWPHIAQLEQAHKKLDSQIFLETYYDLITVPKPKISEASSHSSEPER
jgi:hypothetical protein